MLDLFLNFQTVWLATILGLSCALFSLFTRQYLRVQKIENRLSFLLAPDATEQKSRGQKLLVKRHSRGSFSAAIGMCKKIAYFPLLIFMGLIYGSENWGVLQYLYLFFASLIVAAILIEKRLAKNKKSALKRQFPEFLDLLISGLKAGLSLERLCRQAEQELSNPFKAVIAYINEKLSIGHSIEDVMLQLPAQHKLDELNFLAAAIKLQRSSGGQLSEILTHLRNSLVQRDEHRNLIRSLTAEGRTAALVIVFLIFASLIGLLVFSPAQFSFLLEDTSGQNMLWYSVLSVAAGLVSIYLMTGADHG